MYPNDKRIINEVRLLRFLEQLGGKIGTATLERNLQEMGEEELFSAVPQLIKKKLLRSKLAVLQVTKLGEMISCALYEVTKVNNEHLRVKFEGIEAEIERLQEAATALIKWHDEELPKINNILTTHQIRVGSSFTCNWEYCGPLVETLRKELKN